MKLGRGGLAGTKGPGSPTIDVICLPVDKHSSHSVPNSYLPSHSFSSILYFCS